MYTYPNGLRCRASKIRVTLFELFVPMLAASAGILGLPLLATVYGTIGNTLLIILLVGWSWIVWMIACAALAFGSFVLWCRPIWNADADAALTSK